VAPHSLAMCTTDSRFGEVAVVWSVADGRPKVARVLLPGAGEPARRRAALLFPGLGISSCAEVNALADDIRAFLSGGHIRFSLEAVRMELCSEFQRRVLFAEYEIPRGGVSTYGSIARRLGRPGAARAVGSALAGNPFPIIIPCHRAIRSDGTLGGYQGGPEMKRALLEMEGLEFDARGRVIT
jgi:methylated-DNA-[protein]-cysteine S-methyltransferase